MAGGGRCGTGAASLFGAALLYLRPSAVGFRPRDGSDDAVGAREPARRRIGARERHDRDEKRDEPDAAGHGRSMAHSGVVDTYTPDEAPNPPEWLALDEAVRLNLVIAYHQREKIHVANARLHAAIHTVVETQVAIREQVVVETIARLRQEGLSRHDAIHAVGSVLVARLLAALKQKTTPISLAGAYLEDLKALTAEAWKNS